MTVVALKLDVSLKVHLYYICVHKKPKNKLFGIQKHPII